MRDPSQRRIRFQVGGRKVLSSRIGLIWQVRDWDNGLAALFITLKEEREGIGIRGGEGRWPVQAHSHRGLQHE